MSWLKKGGGFLDGVEGTIVDYEFTDDIMTKEGRQDFEPGSYKGADGKKKERFHWMNCFLHVVPAGAKEPVITTLKAGGFDDFEIEDDGKVLNPVNEGGGVGSNTDLGKFVASLIQPVDGGEGIDESVIEGDKVDLRPILGTRVKFVQVEDERAKAKGLKRHSKDGKKEYDIKNLKAAEVLEVGDGTVATPGKKGGKPTATAGKTNTKGKQVEEGTEEDEVDIAEVAEAKVREYLGDAKGNALPKSKLRMKVLQDKAFSGKGELKEAIIKQIFTDKWLSSLDGVDYDKSDKAQMVSLSE